MKGFPSSVWIHNAIVPTHCQPDAVTDISYRLRTAVRLTHLILEVVIGCWLDDRLQYGRVTLDLALEPADSYQLIDESVVLFGGGGGGGCRGPRAVSAWVNWNGYAKEASPVLVAKPYEQWMHRTHPTTSLFAWITHLGLHAFAFRRNFTNKLSTLQR